MSESYRLLLMQQVIAAKDAEIERLEAALKEIEWHGVDAPSAANYSEADWWRKVAYDCMRIAREAAGTAKGGGE
jgi:hypothetical protein